MRVLHVIDGAGWQKASTTLALMSESLGRLGPVQQKVMLLSGAELERAAKRVGIQEAIQVGVPFEIATLGWASVRRRLKDIGRIDLVHCWSVGALAAMGLMLRGVPRVLTVTTQPTRQAVKWLRIMTRESEGPVVVLPISATIRRELLSGGVGESAVHVLRPGIDMGRVAFGDRLLLRQRWGTESEAEKVVVLLSDPPTAADTLEAARAVVLADGSSATEGYHVRLLVHPEQVNRLRVVKIVRGLGPFKPILADELVAEPWRVLAGCDVALVMGEHGGGLSLLWAMSANVPVVGEATYAISEIVEDRHSALLAKPGAAQTLAFRISQLVGDKQLAWKLKDTARHEAYSFFSRQRYCQSLQRVYEQMTQGQEIMVEPMPVTGGLRFAGRT